MVVLFCGQKKLFLVKNFNRFEFADELIRAQTPIKTFPEPISEYPISEGYIQKNGYFGRRIR